jgi:hypothetical protein
MEDTIDHSDAAARISFTFVLCVMRGLDLSGKGSEPVEADLLTWIPALLLALRHDEVDPCIALEHAPQTA